MGTTKISPERIEISGTEYSYDGRLQEDLDDLRQRVNTLRTLIGNLSPETSERLREYFRLKNIYNSNAIEGNSLSMGETRMVIQEGLTITGKPLKDSVEARNLSHALDFFHELADRDGEPITTRDINNIHKIILKGIDDSNAGRYRMIQVSISGSHYSLPDPAQLDDKMREFGVWIGEITRGSGYAQTDPLILACVAHAWLVRVHPYVDGNGRTARLLMNLILLRYSYPITIVTKDDRQRYYDALEESQGGGDITPFARLVLESALEAVEIYEQAAQEELNLKQFVNSLVGNEEGKLRGEYEVFESAMSLMKGYFRQVAQAISEESKERNITKRVGFKEFGIIEFEKYQTLRRSQSAKKTWFFRLTFYDKENDEDTSRYLFFFGFASNQMSEALGENKVTLHTSTEVYPYYYDKLADLPNAELPNVLELTYLPSEERFIYLDRNGNQYRKKAEEIARDFIGQVFESFGR